VREILLDLPVRDRGLLKGCLSWMNATSDEVLHGIWRGPGYRGAYCCMAGRQEFKAEFRERWARKCPGA